MKRLLLMVALLGATAQMEGVSVNWKNLEKLEKAWTYYNSANDYKSNPYPQVEGEWWKICQRCTFTAGKLTCWCLTPNNVGAEKTSIWIANRGVELDYTVGNNAGTLQFKKK